MKPETRDRIIALGESRLKLVQELPSRPSGLSWCYEHTEIADEIAVLLFEDLYEDRSDSSELSLIATGGFGRRELSPKSDIDLTIVPSDESSAELDGAIRKLFQDLHWAYCTVLRLDVGYAYRLISDSPGLDAKTRTGLLDMRLLAGSRQLFHELEESLHGTFASGEFVLNKIEERDTMYARFNDTPLVMEPHLKEGAGGLRDFHCANWIGEAMGEQPARPTHAYDTIVRYRNLLHFVSGKPNDLLSRNRQADLCELTGISSDRIIEEVATAGSELHRQYLRAKDRLHEGRFSLSGSTLAVNGEVRIMPTSTAGDAAVGIAVATRLGIKVSDLPMRAGDDYGGPSALFAISTGEATLRNLDRCSLLEQLLPELTLCRTLSSGDTIHTYTVFEHTLRVVKMLDSLGQMDFLGEVKASVTDLEPLYLAALLHDVGKVDPKTDHSVSGAEIAREVCKRWELADSAAEMAVWLVREHLTMERFIRIRDIMHPSTVDEFIEIVNDPEKLRLLTLLTWADVNAVAQGTWTQAQDTFLRQLYERSLLRLQGELLPAPDAAQSRQRLLRQLKRRATESRVQEFLESLPVYYLTSTPADVVNLHMQLVEQAALGEATVEEFVRADLGATDLTVCCLDAPGLLSRILGVIYAYDLSVIGIRACTTNTSPPVALDVFTVSFSGRPVPPATLAQVTRALIEVINGSRTVDDVLRQRGKDPNRPQQIFTYTFIAGNPGILEIRAPRGRGMAFRFSRLFAARGWNILAARVGQWAGTGAAAFYVTGRHGEPLPAEAVRRALAEELEGLDAAPAIA
jgi:[protein-PII] uridylyltransferase